MLLLEIRKMPVDTVDLDDAVLALAVLKLAKVEYDNQGIPTPEWFSERLEEIDREVKLRKRDYLQRQLKLAKARVASLKSRDERLKESNDEIQKLESLLKQ